MAQMALGKRLRELRHESGLTLEAVEEATELSNSYLSRIERDHVVPLRDTLEVIADQFGREATNELLRAWDREELERLGYDPKLAAATVAMSRLDSDVRAALIEIVAAELDKPLPSYDNGNIGQPRADKATSPTGN